jgi:hypothetical protein
VFRDDGRLERFLGLLGSVSRDEGWEIHGYCLGSFAVCTGPFGSARGFSAVRGAGQLQQGNRGA